MNTMTHLTIKGACRQPADFMCFFIQRMHEPKRNGRFCMKNRTNPEVAALQGLILYGFSYKLYKIGPLFNLFV